MKPWGQRDWIGVASHAASLAKALHEFSDRQTALELHLVHGHHSPPKLVKSSWLSTGSWRELHRGGLKNVENRNAVWTRPICSVLICSARRRQFGASRPTADSLNGTAARARRTASRKHGPATGRWADCSSGLHRGAGRPGRFQGILGRTWRLALFNPRPAVVATGHCFTLFSTNTGVMAVDRSSVSKLFSSALFAAVALHDSRKSMFKGRTPRLARCRCCRRVRVPQDYNAKKLRESEHNNFGGNAPTEGQARLVRGAPLMLLC